MSAIERAIASVREDCRAESLFDPKVMGFHLRMHPNKFHERWYRTRDWLIEVCAAQPSEAAAEFMAIIALGAAERQRRAGKS